MPRFQRSWLGQALLLFLLCIALPSPVATLATPNKVVVSPHTVLESADHPTELQSRDDKFLLRIMPLGASITEGHLSTDGNGYRSWIRQKLRSEGWEVQMVGSLRHGDMLDNHNEGHYGKRVDQLPSKIRKSIKEEPNLILINLGTNDAIQDHQISTIGERMDYLLTLLYAYVPSTTIVLSTLIPNKVTKVQERSEEINKQYTELVAKRRAQKDRIVLADMSFIQRNDLNDSTHPTDEGYKMMASVWWAAIEEAQKDNFLQKPNYTISEKLEAHLDNSTDDPDLPAYSAPAQPTVGSSSASSLKSAATSGTILRFAPRLLWVVAFSLFFSFFS